MCIQFKNQDAQNCSRMCMCMCMEFIMSGPKTNECSCIFSCWDGNSPRPFVCTIFSGVRMVLAVFLMAAAGALKRFPKTICLYYIFGVWMVLAVFRWLPKTICLYYIFWGADGIGCLPDDCCWCTQGMMECKRSSCTPAKRLPFFPKALHPKSKTLRKLIPIAVSCSFNKRSRKL